VRHGSRGLAGGHDGKPHAYVLRSNAGDRPLRTKEVGVKLSPGDVLLVHSSGGGGWGDAARRSAAQHAADHLSGLVTGTTDRA